MVDETRALHSEPLAPGILSAIEMLRQDPKAELLVSPKNPDVSVDEKQSKNLPGQSAQAPQGRRVEAEIRFTSTPSGSPKA